MSSVDEQLVAEIEQVPVGAAIVLAVVAVAAVVSVAVVRAGDDRDQPVVTARDQPSRPRRRSPRGTVRDPRPCRSRPTPAALSTARRWR